MSLSKYIKYDVWDNFPRHDKDVQFNNRVVSIEDVVFSVLAQMKCQNCGMFRRNYHCMISPRFDRARDMLRKYDNLRFIWVDGDCRERLKIMRDMAREGKIDSTPYITDKLAVTQVNAIVISKLRDICNMLRENMCAEGKKFRVFGPGGGCRKCRVCGAFVKPKQPCKYPEITYTSPESIGIDVYATFKQLHIDIEIPPIQHVMSVGLVVWNDI